MNTTLYDIWRNVPSKNEWDKLLAYLGKIEADDEPLPISTVLKSNGLTFATWVLASCCGEEGRRLCHTFGCDVAADVLHIYERNMPMDDAPRTAIMTKRAWLRGEATDDELEAAFGAAVEANRYASAVEAVARGTPYALSAAETAHSAYAVMLAVKMDARQAAFAADEAAWAFGCSEAESGSRALTTARYSEHLNQVLGFPAQPNNEQ